MNTKLSIVVALLFATLCVTRADGPLKLSDVAKDEWPQQVSLVLPSSFPVMASGKQIGSVTYPVGTLVTVVGVEGENVVVVCRNATTTIPASATDFLARVVAWKLKYTVTINGAHITKIREVNIGTDGCIRIVSAAGVLTYQPSTLPSEFLAQWGLTADVVRRQLEKLEFERLAAEKEAAKKALLALPGLDGEVKQVLPKGLLVYGTKYDHGASDKMDFYLVGYPDFDTVVEGNSISCKARQEGRYQYVTVLGATRTIEKYVYCGNAKTYR